MNASFLRFWNLSYAYEEGRAVLREVSGRIERGERIALIGPNGAGKSTLLLLLMGLLKSPTGGLEILGRRCRLEQDFDEVRGRIGLLFQDSDDQLFNPTVWDEMMFGPLNLGWSFSRAEAKAKETLVLFGIENQASRFTHRLSAGEKRLVALASLWVMEPEALLLDEPTAGLDDSARQRVKAIVASFPGSLVVASHDREFLEGVTSRRWNLVAGHLEIE